MRIACLQFDPTLGQVAANQRRADDLIDRALIPGQTDVLLLPEMAFTGYCFTGRDEVLPFCESPTDGPTARWCRATAQRLGCVVVCGFPELGAGGRLFNSLHAVNPAGETIHIYRKHFLYVTDETWASEGPGFERAEIAGLGRCAFAICMDLNPWKLAPPFDRFEFASSLFDPPLAHHEKPSPEKHRLQVDLVLCCNSWLRSPTDDSLSADEHARHLLNYWAYRMTPALGQPLFLAIANRTGVERTTRFAGTSCVIDLGRRELLGCLDETSEGVLCVGT